MPTPPLLGVDVHTSWAKVLPKRSGVHEGPYGGEPVREIASSPSGAARHHYLLHFLHRNVL